MISLRFVMFGSLFLCLMFTIISMNSIETMSELSSKIKGFFYYTDTNYFIATVLDVAIKIFLFGCVFFMGCKIFMSQKKIQKKTTPFFLKDTIKKYQKQEEVSRNQRNHLQSPIKETGGRPKPPKPPTNPITD